MKSAPLDHAVLKEIYELNQRFIDMVPELPPDRFQADGSELPPLVAGSSAEARRHLARCPFLLFRIVATPAPASIADAAGGARGHPGAERELARLALSFLWQLARANPFAARVVSGTPARWCDELATLSIVRLIETATTCDIELQPRLATVPGFWRDLLGASGPRPPLRREAIGVAGLQLIMSKSRKKRAPEFLPLRH
jgi:hypothetical protein